MSGLAGKGKVKTMTKINMRTFQDWYDLPASVFYRISDLLETGSIEEMVTLVSNGVYKGIVTIDDKGHLVTFE